MPEPPRRKRLQIHLSTAIVMMFTAGILLWMNTRPRNITSAATMTVGNDLFVIQNPEIVSAENHARIVGDGRHPTVFLFTTAYGWPFNAMSLISQVSILNKHRFVGKNIHPDWAAKGIALNCH